MLLKTLKTYACTTCNYKQDFTRGTAETCPANPSHGTLKQLAAPRRRAQARISEDADIDVLTVTEFHADGSTTDRPLTNQEKAARRSLRDASLATVVSREDSAT